MRLTVSWFLEGLRKVPPFLRLCRGNSGARRQNSAARRPAVMLPPTSGQAVNRCLLVLLHLPAFAVGGQEKLLFAVSAILVKR